MYDPRWIFWLSSVHVFPPESDCDSFKGTAIYKPKGFPSSPWFSGGHMAYGRFKCLRTLTSA